MIPPELCIFQIATPISIASSSAAGRVNNPTHEKRTAEGFQHSCDLHKLRRQSVLHEHVLHLEVRPHQLRVAMRKENDAERNAKNQQSKRLQTIQKLHLLNEPRA